MKIFALFILLCALPHVVSCQFENPGWLFTIDAYNDADISDIEVDAEGNTYASVNYMGTLNLQGNNGRPLPNSRHMSGVLIKLDGQGKLLWCRGFESAFDNRINDLTVDADGNVYITGFGDGLMHFPGKSDNYIVGREKGKDEYHQPQGIYIAKYTKDGERAWVHYWSAFGWGEGRNIAVNSKGDVVWSYYHYGELKEKDELIDEFKRSESVQVKVSVAHFKADGTLDHIEPFQYLASESAVKTPRFKYDNADNLFVYGMFSKSITLSEQDSLTNDAYFESMDSYLVKYNNQGKLLWLRQFGGQNYQIIEDIDFGIDGSVYGTGHYSYECVLMDAIKSSQKSKFDYKSGNSLFYFHFFDDGETDFIRFVDGRGYNGTFVGNSIDVDVNGDSHIIGNFTDTLEVDGYKIQGAVYPSNGFSSTWEQIELAQLNEIGTSKESWLLGIRVRSSDFNYAIGGMYYGNDVNVEINGKKQKLIFSEYGRCSFIYGGAVKLKKESNNQNQEVLADLREINRVKRLDGIEALFACKSPELEDAATTWYPTLDSIPSRDSLWINYSPCGLVIEDMEATLFPNPTAGPVTIRLKGMADRLVQIDVYSERGQFMYSQRVQVPSDDYNVDFDMMSAAAGTYFVRISHGNYEKALRLVKMKI